MSRTDMRCAYSEMIMSSRPPGDPARAFRDQQRLERPGPVPRHRQAHRPHPGLHRLGDAAVTVSSPGRRHGRPGRRAHSPGARSARPPGPLQHRLDQLAAAIEPSPVSRSPPASSRDRSSSASSSRSSISSRNGTRTAGPAAAASPVPGRHRRHPRTPAVLAPLPPATAPGPATALFTDFTMFPPTSPGTLTR